MLQFNDTTNKSGILQVIERTLWGEDGYGKITGNTTRLATFTSEVNLAYSRLLALLFEASGTWQYDDSNQTDYPIIKTNIVSGQRDYSFTTDQTGNLVLDIYKVAILQSSTATQYIELEPVDTQSEQDTARRFNDTTYTGIPYDYDKTANGIIFGTLPNYNATNGLLLYINREQTYFTTADTTKKPGFAGLFHEYLALKAAYAHASLNTLSNAPAILNEVLRMEADIKSYYGRREKDVRNTITTKPARAFR